MPEYSKNNLTKIIKSKALELGFEACGISRVEFLGEHENQIKTWLKNKKHGKLDYLEKNLEILLDPTKIVDRAGSVITLLKNYYPKTKQKGGYHIAKYAYGRDYHKVIKGKLGYLADYINSFVSNCNITAFVDSAPVLEKAWAVKSGLGQIGKNTLLITKSKGSFFFISELITDIELEYDSPLPEKDICGNCTLCMDACPTQALYAPYHLDASKCISALTIESKDMIPEKFKGKLNKWIYGCDICQDVCPHNKKSVPHNEELFLPQGDWLNFSDEDWENLTEEKFKIIFKHSAVKRIKYRKFMNNIRLNQD